VWSHKQLLTVVSHTPIEVEKLGKLQAAGGFVDAVRHFIPPEERLYTWWSYRNRDWAASNRGRRLDHVWVTPPLAPGLASAEVLSPARSWDRTSDHVPVVVRLDN
jgi:exodeoxyribonuclease-3